MTPTSVLGRKACAWRSAHVAPLALAGALAAALSGMAACASSGGSGGMPAAVAAPRVPPGAVVITRVADQVRPCPTPEEDTSLAAYDSAAVDRPADAGSGAVMPRYPRELLQLGVTGAVVARYVVNRTGCVEPASIEIVEATDPRFGEAVAFALRRFRYEPAMRDGHAVRQRFSRQQFSFELGGRP